MTWLLVSVPGLVAVAIVVIVALARRPPLKKCTGSADPSNGGGGRPG